MRHAGTKQCPRLRVSGSRTRILSRLRVQFDARQQHCSPGKRGLPGNGKLPSNSPGALRLPGLPCRLNAVQTTVPNASTPTAKQKRGDAADATPPPTHNT